MQMIDHYIYFFAGVPDRRHERRGRGSAAMETQEPTTPCHHAASPFLLHARARQLSALARLRRTHSYGIGRFCFFDLKHIWPIS